LTHATSSSRPSVLRSILIGYCYGAFLSMTTKANVSIGFYPTQNFQPLVKFGSPQNKPTVLTDQHVTTMAEHLPRLCEAMCGNEHCSCKDGLFRLPTPGS
jgi:hypothetical protein